ncbi:type II secretion system F family protein [Candidatus Micrarchaeota archaeon]|nr:type II secretion system F family protein [Candidatus Micrarchaeota archaeon]MBU1165847.1 type II secretion system F family protein [Candidatus Micrarchaeota archaeon]MBU1887009.1 type II secretion system F family protein [Candidatus Micrarchaeota archaeon]
MGIIEYSMYFPKINIKSNSDKIVKMLGYEPQKYTSMSIFVSVMIAIISAMVSMLFDLIDPLLAAVGGFVATFVFFIMIPKIELKKKANEIEAELPIFLKSFGLLLEMNITFQKALEMASKGHGELEKEITNAINEIKNGIGIRKAILSLAITTESMSVKRAVSQIVSLYEIGSAGSEIRRIGDELLSIEQHKLKEYSARSAMFGLFFIMSSAILPTFFLIYAIAGKTILRHNIGETEMALMMLIVFPMISVLILLISKATMPRSAFSAKSGFDIVMLIPGVLLVTGFLVAPDFKMIIIPLGLVTGAYFVYLNYGKEKRAEEIDDRIPDALFSISGMPKSTSPERMFGIIETGEYGALSEEAKKSVQQLKSNVNIDSVLDDLWERNSSSMLRRVCQMLGHMIHTNSIDKVSILAEDIIRSFQIRRERSQIFALQKYTLIFGGVLIALILKMAISLLKSMDGIVDGESIMSSIAFSESLIPAYFIVYSMIAATAIADAEGKKSSLGIYFIVLFVLSMATFVFVTLT